MDKELWIDYRHPSYKDQKRKRTFSRDQYSGNALEVTLRESEHLSHERAVVSAIDDKDNGIRVYDSLGAGNKDGTYLKRRAQGEMGVAFRERAVISRFPAHYSALVDSYVGGVFAVEDKAYRNYDGPLGDPEVVGTPAYYLARDVDGTGLNWESFLISMAGKLIVDEWVWYRVDRETEDDPIRVYWVDPDMVLNWREESGVLVEALTRETRIEQDSLMDEAREVEYYTRWTLDGWELYREVKKEDSPKGEREVILVDSRQYAFPFYTDDKRTQRCLPMGRTRLPLDRYVGYHMAQDHNMLYNLLSDARWNFRVINHPRLAGNVEDDQWVRSLHTIIQGVNALQGDWKYISPEANNGKTAYDVYENEVRQFYITNHQRMNSSNIERSATEVLFNEAAGRTAFLRIFAAAIDEVENGVNFLAAQWESPEDSSNWYGTWVRRSSDFKPIDVQGLIKTQADAFAAVVNRLEVESALRFAREGAVEGLKEREVQEVPAQFTPTMPPEGGDPNV
jgi:hypothetical protein